MSEEISIEYPQFTHYLKLVDRESKSDAAVMTTTMDCFSDWRHKRSGGL
jgi:hypothetical protein